MNGVTGMTNQSPGDETPNSWSEHVGRALPSHVDSRFGADGLPDGAWFGRVSAVAGLGDGRVMVLHRGPAIEPVVIFDRDGQFHSSWDAAIGLPHGMRIDPDGYVWITDVSRHRVIKATTEGGVLMELGQPDEPGVDERSFDKPTDIAFGADGTVFVSDGYGNSRVVAFDAAGRFLHTWGRPGNGPEEFDTPHAVVVAPDGLVWVSDRGNGRISSFEPDGRLVRSWSHLGAAQSLAFSQDGSLLWVMAYRTQTEIIDYDSQGGRLMLVKPDTGAVVASLDVPGHCVHEALDGSVYVANLGGSAIQVRPGWKVGVDAQRDASETAVDRWSDLT